MAFSKASTKLTRTYAYQDGVPANIRRRTLQLESVQKETSLFSKAFSLPVKNALRKTFQKGISWLNSDGTINASGFTGLSSFTQVGRIKYAHEIGNPLTTPLIMASVMWLGRTIHEAPLYVITKNEQGREVGRVYRHPVLDLIKRPNPYSTGKEMMKSLAASWQLDGNAYLLKERNRNGTVIELWYEPHFTIRPRSPGDNLMSPNRVPDPSLTGPGSDFISFYEVWRFGNWYKINSEDVIHFREGNDPLYPNKGMNKLASVLAEVYTDQQRANFSATVLSNIGMIPFVVSPREVGQTITEKQAEKLKEDLELRARSERGKPIVAGRAIRIDELGFSPSDMDLNSMAAIPEERIAAVIGPNAYVLGFIPENSIYTNFLEARRDAYESYLIPLHDYIADRLTYDLLEEFETDDNKHLHYDFSRVPAMAEYQAKLFEMWGKAFRDGIAMRYTALVETGQEATDNDKIYVNDIPHINEQLQENVNIPPEDLSNYPQGGLPAPDTGKLANATTLPNPAVALPGAQQTVNGNNRPKSGPNRGPVAGGKG